MEHIALAPHVIFHLFHTIPVTASHLALFTLTALIFIVAIFIRRSVKVIPSKGQIIVESVVDMFEDMASNSISDQKIVRKVVPFIITFFISILLANLFGILPMANSFVAHLIEKGGHEVASTAEGLGHEALTQEVPFFHVPTTHLSMTMAFAIMAIFLTHAVALSIRPLKHISNFIKISGFFHIKSFMDVVRAGIDMFLGVLEMIGEFAKIVSLSCRLFGNIFAEEVMLIVIMGLFSFTQYIVPMPFIGLIIFGGILQATVFSMLFTQYLGQMIGHLSSDH